jgi:hypothetical protein
VLQKRPFDAEPQGATADILVQMICAPVLARSGIRAVREIGRYGRVL